MRSFALSAIDTSDSPASSCAMTAFGIASGVGDVATWSRDNVITKLKSGDYSLALCAFNFDVGPDPGFTLTSTASCNYTRYRSDDMNDLLGQLRRSFTPDDYQNAMSLIQDQFEQDIPYICLYWRSGALLSRSAFTDARDIRELELLRGVESFGSK